MTRKQRQDPIADYVEWTEHRYDPGYYLGGRIPPYIRRSSLGPRARRLAALVLLFTGLSTAWAAIAGVSGRSPLELAAEGAFALLLLAGALRMYPRRRRDQ